MKYSFGLVAALLLIFACKSETRKADTPSKMQEVMAVHDEVMPRMGRISKLVAELEPMADTTAAGEEYLTAMRDLQAAYRSMMDWMQGFGNRFDSDEVLNGKELTEEKKEWLLEEEKKVNQLREEINGSIARAEKLLSKD